MFINLQQLETALRTTKNYVDDIKDRVADVEQYIESAPDILHVIATPDESAEVTDPNKIPLVLDKTIEEIADAYSNSKPIVIWAGSTPLFLLSTMSSQGSIVYYLFTRFKNVLQYSYESFNITIDLENEPHIYATFGNGILTSPIHISLTMSNGKLVVNNGISYDDLVNHYVDYNTLFYVTYDGEYYYPKTEYSYYYKKPLVFERYNAETSVRKTITFSTDPQDADNPWTYSEETIESGGDGSLWMIIRSSGDPEYPLEIAHQPIGKNTDKFEENDIAEAIASGKEVVLFLERHPNNDDYPNFDLFRFKGIYINPSEPNITNYVFEGSGPSGVYTYPDLYNSTVNPLMSGYVILKRTIGSNSTSYSWSISSPGAIADWDASSTEPGYIANRIAYTDTNNIETITLIDEWFESGQDYISGYKKIPTSVVLEPGLEYIATYNGTEYPGTFDYYDEDRLFLFGSRQQDGVTTNEPFHGSITANGEYNVFLNGTPSESVSLELIINIPTVHTLDDKYLDGILVGRGTGYGSVVVNGDTSGSDARGEYSVAEGRNTWATSTTSHAEGEGTTASGSSSHAEGDHTTASGSWSHAEGTSTMATKDGAHAEGYSTISSGYGTHAEGYCTVATDRYSHAEGGYSVASARYAHSEGGSLYDYHRINLTTDSSDANYLTYKVNSFHEISDATNIIDSVRTLVGCAIGADGAKVVSETIEDGVIKTIKLDKVLSETVVSNKYYQIKNYVSTASGWLSHAENDRTFASGIASHSEGRMTVSKGVTSHAEGYRTLASGDYSHAEGDSATASGTASHAEGGSIASGYRSHAEGYSRATQENAHAEGNSQATGYCSHSEGTFTTASGGSSHAEGIENVASADASHAEGQSTVASGLRAHAEGSQSTASGGESHAEGAYTTASGSYSHAEGFGTTANHQAQHVFGIYNIPDANVANANAKGDYIEIVGNGTYQTPSNARTLDWSGNEWLSGNIKIGGTSYEDANAKEIATKDYVDETIANSVLSDAIITVSGTKLSITTNNT